MKKISLWTRRSLLQVTGVGAIGTFALSGLKAGEPVKAKGNIKQSVCRWCYGKIPLEKLAAEVVKIGYKSVELLSPEEFKVIKPFGLTCAVMRCATGIVDGLNRKENHDRIEKDLRADIEFAAAEGLPNVLCMSGNRQRHGRRRGAEELRRGSSG